MACQKKFNNYKNNLKAWPNLQLSFDLPPVWPDGQIIVRYLAIYEKENFPNATTIAKIDYKFRHVVN